MSEKSDEEIPLKIKLRAKHLRDQVGKIILSQKLSGLWIDAQEYIAWGSLNGSPQVLTIIDRTTHHIFQYISTNDYSDMEGRIVKGDPEYIAKVINNSINLPKKHIEDSLKWS